MDAKLSNFSELSNILSVKNQRVLKIKTLWLVSHSKLW